MKKNRILIYSALIAFLGSCDLELESIDESFIPNADTTIVESDEDTTCANELMAAYGYNAFIQNDVIIESGDTEGAIAMGGNLTINGSFTVATQTAGSFFDNDEDLAASLVMDQLFLTLTITTLQQTQELLLEILTILQEFYYKEINLLKVLMLLTL